MARVTILVDAFGALTGPAARLHRDWGYAALVETGGRRILFDTGNDAEGFAANARSLGVDLTRLDAVVISHRHGDHTDGLHHLRAVNPDVQIYTPDDEYFGGPTPRTFFQRPVVELPPEQRYFGGAVPDSIPHGSPWRARVERVSAGRVLFPGVRVVRAVAPRGQPFAETPELSLVIETDSGPIVLVGCSHPGIERILATVANVEHMASVPNAAGPATAGAASGSIATQPERRPAVRLLVGGLHLVTTPDGEIARLASALQDHWRVDAIAPGHCTGEVAFAVLRRRFGDRYRYAGVGTVIEVR